MTGKSLQLSKYGTAATVDKQTSPTDKTAGALMAVGAFGLGEYINVAADTDYNSVTDQGKYLITNDQNSPNRPPQVGIDNLRALLEVDAAGSSRIIQTVKYLRRRFGGVISGNTTFTRIFDETLNDWGPWTFNYHTGNILGTVSQSGGEVTGAIIERGSDSNGSYTKYADGTFIRNLRISKSGSYTSDLGVTGMGRSDTLFGWSYTGNFISIPTVTITAERDSDDARRAFVCIVSATIDSVTYRIVTTSPTTLGFWIHLQAIGRWY